MGKTKRTKKFGMTKRMISKNDSRVKDPQKKNKQKLKLEQEEKRIPIREVEQQHSSLFFSYNTNLVPPFRVILDTNFINSSLQNKCDIFKCLMDLLLAKCIPCVTDCIIAELEKMGSKYEFSS